VCCSEAACGSAVLGADYMAAVRLWTGAETLRFGSASAEQSLWGTGSDYGLRCGSTCGYYGMVVHGSRHHVARKTGVVLLELLLGAYQWRARDELMCVWRFLVGIMASGVGACWLCMAWPCVLYDTLCRVVWSRACRQLQKSSGLGDVLVERCSSERAASLK